LRFKEGQTDGKEWEYKEKPYLKPKPGRPSLWRFANPDVLANWPEPRVASPYFKIGRTIRYRVSDLIHSWKTHTTCHEIDRRNSHYHATSPPPN